MCVIFYHDYNSTKTIEKVCKLQSYADDESLFYSKKIHHFMDISLTIFLKSQFNKINISSEYE